MLLLLTIQALIMLSKGSSQGLQLFFASSWAIWYNRNQVVHNETCLHPSQVWDIAKNTVDDFKRAIVNDVPLARAPHPGWVTPPKGVYKINGDGATSNDGRNFNIGVIIRNERGQQIATPCKILQAQYSAELVKAIAMKQGVLLAQEMECSYVIFGVNSLSVIQAINDSNTSSDYDHIVQEIQLARTSLLVTASIV